MFKTDNSVYITKCENYGEEAVRNALLSAFSFLGAENIIKPGMKVGIKVNLVASLKPERAATTHPEMVAQLCRIISEMGAQPIVGDSPGGIFSASYLKVIYSVTGMAEAEKYGGKLNMDFGQREAEFCEAKSAKTFQYTSWLDNVDVIINFSKLKTHAMMGMSAAVKNMFGAVPGMIKPEYHLRFPDEERFADMLIDLNEYFKPCFNLVDAVVGMEGNGPTSGEPRKIGALIAGASPYCTDMVCARIIGAGFSEVTTIAAAQKRGLCPESFDELNITGNIGDYLQKDFKLIKSHKSLEMYDENGGIFSKAFHAVYKAAMDSKPVVKKPKCVGCEKCKNMCPAKAITMKNAKPYIDRKKCIKCFCCQEFCPKGAISAHRPKVAKILSKL